MNTALKINISEIAELAKVFISTRPLTDSSSSKSNVLQNMIQYFTSCLNQGEVVLSGEAIMNSCFPNCKNIDVFISHSHKDIEKVRFLKEYLEIQLGLRCFVDSDVWHNSYDLLSELDRKFSQGDAKGILEYKKCKEMAANVYLMLSTALTYMIDTCPLVLFVASPNSQISYQNAKMLQDKTYSPWLFHEISMAHLLPRKELERPNVENGITKVASAQVKIIYPLKVDDFKQITAADLDKIYKNNLIIESIPILNHYMILKEMCDMGNGLV